MSIVIDGKPVDGGGGGGGGGPVDNIAIKDANGKVWELGVDTEGFLFVVGDKEG